MSEAEVSELAHNEAMAKENARCSQRSNLEPIGKRVI
jgi:hypothetical protein